MDKTKNICHTCGKIIEINEFFSSITLEQNKQVNVCVPCLEEKQTVPEKPDNAINEDSVVAKLYGIIDNISTGFDMFHPEMKGFEKYVSAQVEKAGKYINSDGYYLFFTDDINKGETK